jgi:hypothetical protein
MTEVAAKGAGFTDSADDQSSSHLVLVIPKLRHEDERRHLCCLSPLHAFSHPMSASVLCAGSVQVFGRRHDGLTTR